MGWASPLGWRRLQTMSDLTDLTERARAIFAEIVENYLETGAPMGSKNLAARLDEKLSPASIRATMAELEQLGLLYAPHVSAGRLPTESGLKLFVDGMLQTGHLSEAERAELAGDMVSPHAESGGDIDALLHQAAEKLSGLSACAGLVLAPNAEHAIKHIEFVAVSDTHILVILVDDGNRVENRLMPRPAGLLPQTLNEAANYLNHRLKGRTLGELRRDREAEISRLEQELDQLTARLVKDGLISWGGEKTPGGNSDMFAKSLIVHGREKLLDDVAAMQDLERIRHLFDDLDRQKELIALLSEAETGDGVKIFIGAQTPLFSLSGSSVIISPYHDETRQLVGVVGVIAPTRSNYARLIPMVDHTAQTVSTLLSRHNGS